MKLLATILTAVLFTLFFSFTNKPVESSWIRINLLGYKPNSVKVAVWCSKEDKNISAFQLVNADTKQVVFTAPAGKAFGAYGPFTQTYRLDFSPFLQSGKYLLRVGETQSPVFFIKEDVYKGAADFCLRYMRQQRTGFNPFLKDSCHTHDGYVLYGSNAGIKDSTHIDVVGGWHDASDYLQYSTTSANATYHLLMAYRDYPQVFSDQKLANGLDGTNGVPDVLDEAVWGLKWLQKMNPKTGWMFNQIADDRDHISMRIPKEDSQYGRGYERPVYFVSGESQQRGKFMNTTTGTSSIAGKFAATFALAQSLSAKDPLFRKADNTTTYFSKALAAYQYGLKKPGYTQTASVASPYIYAEENWVDDMELGAAAIDNMMSRSGRNERSAYISQALNYAAMEKVTPWLGGDTAKHYQWYPFINVGHHELAKDLKAKHSKQAATVIGYYKDGIERVWLKAKQNAFYRAIPYIWCSNNLTTSFATQCLWYRQLSGDNEYTALEQANFDWLFGCNPWGSSFVYGLPDNGDTPTDPHSAFSHILHAPVDGALVDGPVYGSIFKGLIGLKLYNEDSYAPFQSTLAVYHDDYGDYSSNEPTMDGTASLIYLLAAKEADKTATLKSRGSKKKPRPVISFHHMEPL
jgi:endoglucanase